MPLCVHCAYPAEHLYTTYKTKSNIRLAVCPRCDQFSDPLIEHPPLVLLLDLILLKPRVFLHLLFNRGSEPLDATATTPQKSEDGRRRRRINMAVTQLMILVVIAETVVRFLPRLQDGEVWIGQVFRFMLAVVVETIAQHAVTLGLALLALRYRRWYPDSNRDQDKTVLDGRQDNFLPSLIPLTLLYTSLLPLLLQLFLSIWYTTPIQSPHETLQTRSSITFIGLLPQSLLEGFPDLLEFDHALNHFWLNSDRVWAGTKLLGGMSAGFGLRVLLPTKPWETTTFVLAGWVGAATTGRGMEMLVGGRI